jgi:hypothetical protein
VFNYYATIITFNHDYLLDLERQIERFVVGNLNISREKIYGPIESGGLNLFKLDTFSMTLQSFWIKRIFDKKHDNWRNTAFYLNRSGLQYVKEEDLSGCGEILKGILKNFIRYRELYGTVKNNFLQTPIINNPFFTYSRNRTRFTIDKTLFWPDDVGPVPLPPPPVPVPVPAQLRAALDALTWENLTNNLQPKTFQEINAAFGTELNAVSHGLLFSSFAKAKQTFLSESDTCTNIVDFLTGIKKGSQKLRKILSYSKFKPLKTKCPVRKFSETAGVDYPGTEIAKKLNSRWTKNYYSSDQRTFLFKLFHNTLGINSRVCHYNPERSSSCTFCEISKNLPAERETIMHVFWYCPSVTQSINPLLRNTLTFDVSNQNFFSGTDSTGSFSEPLSIIFDLIKYIIWLTKLRRRLPTAHSINSDFFYFMGIIMGTNKKTNDIITDCKFLRRNRRDD